MQRAGESSGGCEHKPLAPDIQRLIRIVACWAAERPIVLELALFGDRVYAAARPPAPLTVAVRFDDRRMNDGFDDWIEQLRTNFAELESELGEKVSVLTPDLGTCCTRAFLGTEIRALAVGKVRVVIESEAPVPEAAPLVLASQLPQRSGPWAVLAAAWMSLPSEWVPMSRR
jgi:hypothetical protein